MNETEGLIMPVYMDARRRLASGVNAAEVALVHVAAIAIQERFGVMYRNYWVDERAGKVFCLIEAPITPA